MADQYGRFQTIMNAGNNFAGANFVKGKLRSFCEQTVLAGQAGSFSLASLQLNAVVINIHVTLVSGTVAQTLDIGDAEDATRYADAVGVGAIAARTSSMNQAGGHQFEIVQANQQEIIAVGSAAITGTLYTEVIYQVE